MSEYLHCALRFSRNKMKDRDNVPGVDRLAEQIQIDAGHDLVYQHPITQPIDGLTEVLRSCEELTETLKRGEEMARYLDLFAATKSPDSAKSFANMHDIALIYGCLGDADLEVGMNPLKETVQSAMHRYIEQSFGEEENGKVGLKETKQMAIMSDIPRLSSEVMSYLGLDDDARDAQADFMRPASEMRWLEVEKIVKGVNVQSILVKSSELMYRIKHYQEGLGDTQLFKDVQQVESFYAPVMDALGLNAAAAEMLSICNIRRLQKQGGQRYVEQAKTMYEQAIDADLPNLIRTVFNFDEDPVLHRVVDSSDDDYERGVNSHFYEIISTTEDGQRVKIKIRIKSIGSIARKLSQNEGKNQSLMDLIGIKTVIGDINIPEDETELDSQERITKQRRQLAHEFSRVVENLDQAGPRVEFHSTEPGRRKPLYAQGSQETNFISDLKESMAGAGSADVERVQFENPEGPAYEVAKIMAYIDGMPCEIQFQTADFYYNHDKKGAYNHTVHAMGSKLRGVDGDHIQAMRSVIDTAMYIGSDGVNKTSLGMAVRGLVASFVDRQPY